MRMGWANDARAALWRWKRDVALPLGQGMAVVHAPQGLFMAGIRTHASRSDRTAWHESISECIPQTTYLHLLIAFLPGDTERPGLACPMAQWMLMTERLGRNTAACSELSHNRLYEYTISRCAACPTPLL